MPRVKNDKFRKEATARYLQAIGTISRELGLTIEEMEPKTKVARSNISRMRRLGKNGVTIEMVNDLWEAYGISPDWIITGRGTMKDLPESELAKKIKAIEKIIAS